MSTTLNAQEHLVPEPGLLAECDEYDFKVREVFAAVYAEDVICRVVILASFVPEQVVGVRKTESGQEVFSMTPSTAIWDTEVVRMHEAGQIQSFNKDGKKLTLEEDESSQSLKKRTPADFRKITTEVKAIAIDKALAHRIAAIWERMLLATRYPKEHRQGLDGASYHFSMFCAGRGVISGQVWSPANKTKTSTLVDLADALSQYALGRTDAEALKQTLNRVEKIIKA
jgi:hypothetical protein